MNDKLENRFSMFLKVKTFIEHHNATLAVNPAIITLGNDFKILLDSITTHEGLATTRIKGYTEQKRLGRQALIASVRKVSAALFAYWLNTAAVSELKPGDYSERSLSRGTDGNLHLRATRLHLLADPVKALLGPYNCAAADVDGLLLKTQQFASDVELPKQMRKQRSDARKKLNALFRQATAMLADLDIYMAVYESVNANLFSKYTTARAIDNMRGKPKKKKDKEDSTPVP